jgi:hypothetical protein
LQLKGRGVARRTDPIRRHGRGDLLGLRARRAPWLDGDHHHETTQPRWTYAHGASYSNGRAARGDAALREDASDARSCAASAAIAAQIVRPSRLIDLADRVERFAACATRTATRLPPRDAEPARAFDPRGE